MWLQPGSHPPSQLSDVRAMPLISASALSLRSCDAQRSSHCRLLKGALADCWDGPAASDVFPSFLTAPLFSWGSVPSGTQLTSWHTSTSPAERPHSSSEVQRKAGAQAQGSSGLRVGSKRLIEGCRKATARAAFDLLGYKARTVLAHLELMSYFQSPTLEVEDFTAMSQLRWSQAAKCLEKNQDKNATRIGSLAQGKQRFSALPLFFPKENSKPAGAPRQGGQAFISTFRTAPSKSIVCPGASRAPCLWTHASL